jgi:regulator of replication initiation timing
MFRHIVDNYVEGLQDDIEILEAEIERLKADLRDARDENRQLLQEIENLQCGDY